MFAGQHEEPLKTTYSIIIHKQIFSRNEYFSAVLITYYDALCLASSVVNAKYLPNWKLLVAPQSDNPKEWKIKQIIVYDGYYTDEKSNDIAIIKVSGFIVKSLRGH